jgi:hypothetical protein
MSGAVNSNPVVISAGAEEIVAGSITMGPGIGIWFKIIDSLQI